MFAKIDKIDLLVNLFVGRTLCIPSAVELELRQAQAAGFDYLSMAKNKGIIPKGLETEEQAKLKRALLRDGTIHNGEAEGIVLAKFTAGFFVTNDGIAQQKCREVGASYLTLQDILRALHTRGILRKKEVEKLIEEIETKDNTRIFRKDEILRSHTNFDPEKECTPRKTNFS